MNPRIGRGAAGSLARLSAIAIGCAMVAGIAGFATTDVHSASIPAWLDDAISDWNQENPAQQIAFVDIKDSFVWYQIPRTSDIGHRQIRENVYGIVLRHGYKLAAAEELVTTGKPPAPTGAHKAKKCWSRSFVLDIEELSNTTSPSGDRSGLRQRMLTSLVCEDTEDWYAGFRILQ